MRVLAFDTSTEFCSAALWQDGDIAAERVHAGQTHSELLLPMIGRLLADGGVALRDLDGIAFGEGPGSFTGLRIACGVAQGLAFGADLPVAGISTLLAMAEASGAQRALCCLDARMGEVYHAAYHRDDGLWQVQMPPAVSPPGAVAVPPGAGWVACGNGFAVYAAALGAVTAHAEVRAEVMPDARAIAALGARCFAQGGGLPADAAQPVYLRDKVALRTDERPA